MTIYILLLYYNRPNLVRNALNSILAEEAAYPHLDINTIFIDDGSTLPPPQELLSKLKKIKYINTNHTTQDKLNNNGSHIGKIMNEALEEAPPSSIAIMLCDDDALYPGYLNTLSIYFTNNPQIQYGYSKIIPFNPETQTPPHVAPSSSSLNKTGPINPSCQVDASQVAWRTDIHKKYDIWFPWPKTSSLDAAFYHQLQTKIGPCQPIKTYGQFKAVFPDQLGNRKHDMYKVKIQ